jgi:hypothetical protein
MSYRSEQPRWLEKSSCLIEISNENQGNFRGNCFTAVSVGKQRIVLTLQHSQGES